MRVGLIARSDKTGLGLQLQRIARLINPDKVMLIDSTPFNGNQQFPEKYKQYDVMEITGFPNDEQIRDFLAAVDVVFSAEMFYSNHFTRIAKTMRKKTVLHANPEFFDWFKSNYVFVPQPTTIVVPSMWMYRRMHREFNAKYLPTPIFEDEFAKALKVNVARTKGRKFLFVNGKSAAEDRNGLQSIYAALELAKGDFTVTVKAQNDVVKHPDPRLIYDFSNPDDVQDLYMDFDAMILPRRYGGQSLPMTEALTCGLPVLMTDIDPNNKVLPDEWLIPAYKSGALMTRLPVDVYSAHPQALAVMLDNLDVGPDAKLQATLLSLEYEAEKLRPKYMELFK